ncbi:MAG: zinc ribbon domain-containing protein [Lachnospiraceae bacterium]|nr:zinc ribbon domain-containing protein [Lachnospiraceae bacterium]
MALINCPECNKEISNTAKTCPNCGYKINKEKCIFRILNNTITFILSIILDIVVGIIGISLFNKGKSEMLFWVQMKRDLGVEDAIYCIRNIKKYTLMKNVGIILMVITIVLIILLITYKTYLYSKNTNK